MENQVENYTSMTDLVEENPYDNGRQTPIYLSLDWENGSVEVILYEELNSCPVDVFHGLRTWIRMPNNVDATRVSSDVDGLMPIINRIASGYESVWNGSNYIGRFAVRAEEDLRSLQFSIDYNPQSIFSCDNNIWLWDVSDWLAYGVDGLEDCETEQDLIDLAQIIDEEARDFGAVIKGGQNEILNYLKELAEE